MDGRCQPLRLAGKVILRQASVSGRVSVTFWKVFVLQVQCHLSSCPGASSAILADVLTCAFGDGIRCLVRVTEPQNGERKATQESSF